MKRYFCIIDNIGIVDTRQLLARENNWIEANKQYFYGYHFPSKYQITRLTINLSQLQNIYLIFVVEKLKNLRGSC